MNWIQFCVNLLEEMKYCNSWGTSKVLASEILSCFHLFLPYWKIHGKWINSLCWRPSGNSWSRLNCTWYLIKTFQRLFLGGRGVWKPGTRFDRKTRQIRIQYVGNYGNVFIKKKYTDRDIRWWLNTNAEPLKWCLASGCSLGLFSSAGWCVWLQDADNFSIIWQSTYLC